MVDVHGLRALAKSQRDVVGLAAFECTSEATYLAENRRTIHRQVYDGILREHQVTIAVGLEPGLTTFSFLIDLVLVREQQVERGLRVQFRGNPIERAEIIHLRLR